MIRYSLSACPCMIANPPRLRNSSTRMNMVAELQTTNTKGRGVRDWVVGGKGEEREITFY